MIFLDTDILSYYFSGNAIIRDKLLKAVQSGKKICLTCINVYEILATVATGQEKFSGNLFQQYFGTCYSKRGVPFLFYSFVFAWLCKNSICSPLQP